MFYFVAILGQTPSIYDFIVQKATYVHCCFIVLHHLLIFRNQICLEESFKRH